MAFLEFSASNTCRRILHIIHEEKLELDILQEETSAAEEETLGFRESMKSFVLQGIAEIMDEIETSSSHVASQALEHIHTKFD